MTTRTQETMDELLAALRREHAALGDAGDVLNTAQRAGALLEPDAVPSKASRAPWRRRGARSPRSSPNSPSRISWLGVLDALTAETLRRPGRSRPGRARPQDGEGALRRSSCPSSKSTAVSTSGTNWCPEHGCRSMTCCARRATRTWAPWRARRASAWRGSLPRVGHRLAELRRRLATRHKGRWILRGRRPRHCWGRCCPRSRTRPARSRVTRGLKAGDMKR